MKKSLILVVALIVLAVLAGCNADQIAGFGKGMEKIGDAGLGTRRNEPMNAAVENVKAYVETTEKNLTWNSVSIEGRDGFLDFKDSDAKLEFVKSIEQTVDILLTAKESSARSKALKEALNAKYQGKNPAKAYKNLHEGLSHEAVMAGDLLANLEDPERRANLVMLLSYLLKTKIGGEEIEKIKNAIQTLKDTNLPIPVQAGDYTLIINLLFKEVQPIVELVKNGSSGGGGRKINLDALKQFQQDVLDSAGDRDYQTVGDKIVVGIMYTMLNTVVDIDNAYKETTYYTQAPDGHKYDEFFTFVLDSTHGRSYVDKMLNYLQAISYVYDVKLDISGLVSGLI